MPDYKALGASILELTATYPFEDVPAPSSYYDSSFILENLPLPSIVEELGGYESGGLYLRALFGSFY